MRRLSRFFMAVFCIVAMAIFGSNVAAQAGNNNVGDFLGHVLHTDIRVSIEDVPIMGYNFNNQTFVVARDLTAHGFTISWDEASRRVDIARGTSTTLPQNVAGNVHPVGSIAFDVLYTDIVTYVNGSRIDSFNVDGATVVRITDVVRLTGGTYNWNPTERTVSVQMPHNSENFVREVFDLVNNLRLSYTLAPLQWHDGLTYVADTHLLDIYQNNLTVTNTGSDGTTLAQRVTRHGIDVLSPSGFTMVVTKNRSRESP